MTPPAHVIVVGGGILGTSTAAHLAELGTAVTLVTEGPIASGASGRSLAWLNSSLIRNPAYHRLRLAGIERYRILGSRLGDVGWLRFGGGLAWGGPIGQVDEAHAHQRAIGYPGRVLSPSEVATLVPGVAPEAIPETGALFNAGEGWVDLPSLSAHLVERLTAAGGRVHTDAGPARPVVEHGRATGVRLDDGSTLDADAVVLATGANVPAMLAEFGIAIPESTPISFLVRTGPVDVELAAVLNTPRVSLRPTPDGRIVMDAGWAEDEIARHPDGTFTVPEGLDKALLDEASEVLAGHPALTVASVHAGPKPVPGDGEPVLGRLDAIAGCHVAFTHSGATLGLIAGELIADEIVTGDAHPLLDPFRPGRFT
jgi:glycine/D-amino acid oxidase-like deaminating enzyme